MLYLYILITPFTTGLEPKFNAIVNDKKYLRLPVVFADLTIQNNKDYIKSIGVLALPTVQFYAHGAKVDTFPCGPSKVPILKKKLADFINDNVDSKSLKLKPPGQDILLEDVRATAKATAEREEQETGASVAEREKSRLRAIPYFSTLLESEFDSVLSKANLLTFESGSIIMREGNCGRTFYFVVEGEVEICQRTSFEDPLTTPPAYLGTVINHFASGEYFGERALITGEPRAASIRAAARTTCLSFDKDDFPTSCVLSGQVDTTGRTQELDTMNERYGVELDNFSSINDKQFKDALEASQVRGSANNPQPIAGVDTDEEIPDFEEVVVPQVSAESFSTGFGETEVIIPLLQRFKLIRLVTRCFDYIVKNNLRFGEEGSRRRRNMLVKLLSPSQQVDFTDAFNLIDEDGNGEITLAELRRLMDSVGEEKSDSELTTFIETSHQAMDGREIITYEDFIGLMAEADFYNLFFETFRALDKRDSGYVRAKDLDRVLCGVRDLITDDRNSLIDVEDTDMMIDYELFSKMLLGTALK